MRERDRETERQREREREKDRERGRDRETEREGKLLLHICFVLFPYLSLHLLSLSLTTLSRRNHIRDKGSPQAEMSISSS